MTKQEKKAMMDSTVADWRESGMSQTDYARTHGIKKSTLRYWIAKTGTSGNQSDFIQVGLPVGQNIRIRYPQGVELILPVQTPAGMLRMLISL
jgi:transposase-like protein